MPARLRALVTAVCATVLGALLLPAGPAQAASRTVQGGRLDWGVKSSFQSYVTGPIAKGSYSLTGGAATVGSSQFRFPSATGSYDGDTGAFHASFAGGVHFVGHRTGGGSYQLDLTLSRPTVRISGGSGTLYLDVTSKAKGTGTVTTSAQVPFASLSLRGIDMRGGGSSVALANVPATLTAQGATSFAGYYTAGTALDPVTLAADVRPAATATSPKPSTSAGHKEKRSQKPGALVDGAVDWGVRRTFREYVTGDIAHGRWTLADGARDGGALFRFPAGEGTYAKGELTAHFRGTLRFTGKHGLDLEFGRVAATVHDGEGTLYADVTSAGTTTRKVPLVTFTAKDFTAEKGLAKLTEAPARLTAEGAKAFGGMYRPGTAMDPVSLAVTLTDDARLPVLPDPGSAADPTPSPAPTPAAATTKADDGTHDDGPPVLPLALTAAGVLLLAAGGTYALRRHRARKAAGQG
ncbi:HtaA domain-containing protein [Streptomyces sp. LP11]|uniref:HtaA domain-containing protein n=1 Tax=Streptomyces pyxinicus TaxID=2970331 RepID=A0ABT2B9R5_9ACTN|nr:HtaA domain-containing protein [Streptomyces sp. LP11]MCS0605256.1 HtaA domain-containing protein [Streptomyces sp. LP11]